MVLDEEDIDNSIPLFDHQNNGTSTSQHQEEHSTAESIILLEKIGPTQSIHHRCDAHHQSVKNVGTAQFSFADITVGKVLGAGGFCTVRAAQITAIGEEDHQSAIKMSRPRDKDNKARYELTIEDMKNEADILSSLSHQNIIELKGVSRTDEPEIYFLIVGRLGYTLSQEMSRWQERLSWLKSAQDARKALQFRLEDVAIGIANGLAYLHQKGIVHRDIKPENIGFDELDTPVLFDFGLARRFQPDDDTNFYQTTTSEPDSKGSTVSIMSAIDDNADDSDAFSASTNTHSSALTDNTGLAGTPRYMAPEIGRGEQYGASADVYSFAILVWQLATLKRPYSKFKTFESLDRHVYNGNVRPNRRGILNTTLRNLLKQSWNGCAATRPPIAWVRLQLKQIVQELAEGVQSDDTLQQSCMKPWVFLKKQRFSTRLSQGLPREEDKRQQRRASAQF